MPTATERHGGSFAVATSSGTASLEAILRALDVAGGEVIVPTNTFAATAFAVLNAGARPVLADIRRDLTLNPEDAAQRITDDTRAVITVHIGGLVSPATLDLVELCRARDTPWSRTPRTRTAARSTAVPRVPSASPGPSRSSRRRS